MNPEENQEEVCENCECDGEDCYEEKDSFLDQEAIEWGVSKGSEYLGFILPFLELNFDKDRLLDIVRDKMILDNNLLIAKMGGIPKQEDDFEKI